MLIHLSVANSVCECRQGAPGWRTVHVTTAWRHRWERSYSPLGWSALRLMTQTVFRSGPLKFVWTKIKTDFCAISLTVSKHQQSNISLGCKFLSEYYFLFLFVSSSCRVEALFKAMWMVAARLVSLKITFLILVLCLLQLVRGVNALLPGSGWAYWLKRLRAWPFLEGLRCSPVADDILKSLAFTGVLQIFCWAIRGFSVSE